MTHGDTREQAIADALKAADEIAAALSTHLSQEHHAEPVRTVGSRTAFTDSLNLLALARMRIAQGLHVLNENGAPTGG